MSDKVTHPHISAEGCAAVVVCQTVDRSPRAPACVNLHVFVFTGSAATGARAKVLNGTVLYVSCTTVHGLYSTARKTAWTTSFFVWQQPHHVSVRARRACRSPSKANTPSHRSVCPRHSCPSRPLPPRLVRMRIKRDVHASKPAARMPLINTEAERF
eukprot:5350241-Prymnesium_polylepis.1